MRLSAKLTIFEGSDGSGKTTAAEKYAEDTGARYVHFNNLPNVGHGLARMYVEAMLPALLGYQDVVFDRCWLSELPYGTAFRGGKDRLGEASRRMLERLAMRCGAVVVRCCPPWESVERTYLGRQDEEYLTNTEELKLVYDLYKVYHTGLPELVYDYTQGKVLDTFRLEHLRMARHPLTIASAGNWRAETVLVGEEFTTQKDYDPFYQWPFASFSDQGCSRWLTQQLIQAKVPERHVLWLNADQDLSVIKTLKPKRVIALGNEAYAQLYELEIPAVKVTHPQYHKRFKIIEPYELTKYL